MDGKLKVLRRKSKKGGMYDALVFFPDENIAGMEKGIVVSFDKLIMYRLADAEGVAYLSRRKYSWNGKRHRG
nr:MAG TPA: hypothetical protein [Inoviridae sp.]